MKPKLSSFNSWKSITSLTRRVPRIVFFVMLGCCALISAATPTAAPAQSLQKITDKFIGAWRLVSVEGNSPVRNVLYEHPTGLVIYDPSGWFSLQIAVHGERKPFAKGVSAGTAEEKAQAFDSYFAYYGTYTVDANAETITHHITDHSYPGFSGRDNVRWFEFQNENRFVLIPVEDGKGGILNRKDATYKLFWERIR